jgi:hypothetical protein
MRNARRVAGFGGVAFAVCLVAGFTFFGPRGGFYSAAGVSNFVAQNPTNIVVSFYLFAVSITALVVLMAYLSETYLGRSPRVRVAWGTSLLAAASMLIGWALYFAPSTAVISGGPAIDSATRYTFLNAGFVVLFGAGGMFLGVALLALAIGGNVAPTWVRALSALAGLSALFSWAFLLLSHWSPNQWLPVPFYVVLLWALVTGVWLLLSSPRPTSNLTP